MSRNPSLSSDENKLASLEATQPRQSPTVALPSPHHLLPRRLLKIITIMMIAVTLTIILRIMMATHGAIQFFGYDDQ